MRQQIRQVRAVIHLLPQAKNMTVTKTRVAELTPAWQREVTIAYSEFQKKKSDKRFSPGHLVTNGRTDGRLRLKCDGTRAETRFRLSAQRTSPFKSAGRRQFNRLLAAEVCGISGSNAGYTMFRGSVKGTGYPLHSPVHLNRPGGVSSVDYWQPRCAPSAVVMLNTPCSEVV